MKESLKDKIVWHLKLNRDKWIHKGEILNTKFTYTHKGITKTAMQNTIDRELRLAEESKLIAKKPDENKSGYYKYLPKELQANYIPFSHREDNRIMFTK